MECNPLFSIIVPIYKVEKYLEQCIESILEQTFTKFELILVDDGSPDRCPEICDEFARRDERIKVIHKANGGLVSARKAGVKVATGEYVLNVDGDDFVQKTWLESFAAVIRMYSPDCVATGFTMVAENGDYIDIRTNRISEGFYDREHMFRIFEVSLFDVSKRCLNMGDIFYSVCMKGIKREIITKAQLNVLDIIQNGEDAAVVFLALEACDSVYVYNSTEYCYRQNMKSMVRTFRADELVRQAELFSYLGEKLANIPRRNIDGYIVYQTVSQIVRATQNMRDIREFCHYASEQITPALQEKIDNICIKRWQVRDYIKVWLLKKKKHALLWLCFHWR